MLRSLLVRCAAVAAALAIPVGVAGAASDDSEPDDSAPASTVPGSSVPADEPAGGQPPPGDIDFQVDMMLGLVPEDEMEAYYLEEGEQRELKIQECMNEAGFEYNPENVEEMYSFDPYAGLSPVEYAEQWGFGMYTMMDPESTMSQDLGQDYVWPNEDIVNSLSAAEQAAWYEVNNRCSNEAWTEDDPYSNPMVQQAIEDFYTDVENDPRVVGAKEAWLACMEEAGHPFASEEDMWETIYDDELQQQFWESEAWKPDSPDYAEWQSMVEQEIGVAVANATCAPPLEEARQEVVADLRPEFVEVWQTIDWSLPPVTYPEDELIFDESGEVIDVGTGSSVPEGPDGTDDTPVAIDLSEPVETSAPPTSGP